MKESTLLPLAAADHRLHLSVSAGPLTAAPTTAGDPAVEIVDPDRWNDLVTGRTHYDVEQGWAWGEAQRATGWSMHRYAVLVGDECIAAAGVACRRLPGLPYSVLYASRGPLLDWDNDLAWRGLLAAIRTLARQRRAVFLRLSPGVPNDEPGPREALARHGFRPLPDDWTTWNAARVTLTLDLRLDEDGLRRRLRKTIRNEIGAAQRRGVTVRAARDRADLVAFHRLMLSMGREKGYPVRRLGRLEALWRAYVARGAGLLLLAEHEGAVVGGVLGLRLGRRMFLQSAAVLRTGPRVYQGPLMYWEFIRQAKASGCDLIDWGGSGTHYPPRESDGGYGVYQFKAGFGSDLRYWAPYHDLVFRPGLYRLARIAEHRLLPTAWRLRAWLNR